MENVLTALQSECGQLLRTVVGMLLDMITGNLRQLMRDVRALEGKVRLWLIAGAEPIEAPRTKPRAVEPDWLRQMKQAERSEHARRAAAQRRPRNALAFSLSDRAKASSGHKPPTPQRSAPSSHGVNRLIQIIQLQNRLLRLKQILEQRPPIVLRGRFRMKATAPLASFPAPVSGAPTVPHPALRKILPRGDT